jgi:hypothetical protein
LFENDEKPTLLYEIDLISDFRKMSKEGKKIIASNIKLIVGG